MHSKTFLSTHIPARARLQLTANVGQTPLCVTIYLGGGSTPGFECSHHRILLSLVNAEKMKSKQHYAYTEFEIKPTLGNDIDRMNCDFTNVCIRVLPSIWKEAE